MVCSMPVPCGKHVAGGQAQRAQHARQQLYGKALLGETEPQEAVQEGQGVHSRMQQMLADSPPGHRCTP